jgi:hypothetical protein
VFVYALAHPRTGVVRYVGMTSRPPRTRYQQHLLRAPKGEGAPAVDAWINKLAANGMLPSLRILEEVGNGDDGAEEEACWIERHQDTILNATAEHLILAEQWRAVNAWHRLYARLSTEKRAATVELDRIEQGNRVARDMLRQQEGLEGVDVVGWSVTLRRFSRGYAP